LAQARCLPPLARCVVGLAPNIAHGKMDVRLVPPLDPQAMRAAANPGAAAKDEVAAILKGLQLDKRFFMSRLQQDTLQDLMPVMPKSMQREGMADMDESGQARIKKVKSKGMKATGTSGGEQGADFDIYLNEAVMPVLAQALDSLCRQLTRMEQQGDQLDPKVRQRFNPMTFLGQQLLRRHPRCARTPRRQGIYRNFSAWADQERGRREMLRRKESVHQVFKGFLLRGVVQRDTISTVLESIDDTMQLGGLLKSHPEMQRVFMGGGEEEDLTRQKSSGPRRKANFKGTTFDFSTFWYLFANVIMSHDVVPFSVIQRGIEIQKQMALDRAKREEEDRKFEEERLRKEEEQRQQLAAYEILYESLITNDQLADILNNSKILTGDDVRPTDPGYEFEVTPKGKHVTLLADLLILLGFESLRTAEPEPERFWDGNLACAWQVCQEMFKVEIADGVVEREVLERLIVPPVGFMMLRGMVEDELERRNDTPGSKDKDDDDDAAMALASGGKKPSMDELGMKFGMTMARIDWLHQLFESFLPPDPNAGPNDPPPCCLYPDCPAAIPKAQMKNLISEMKPDLTEAEFEMRFSRIDEDGSGMVEFDEFVQWIYTDDVKVAGSAGGAKMSFDELADMHGETIEMIKYIYSTFVDTLGEGQVDRYPEQPGALTREESARLCKVLAPRMSQTDFEESFDRVDLDAKGQLDFDEFLEVVDLDELPAELRDNYGG